MRCAPYPAWARPLVLLIILAGLGALEAFTLNAELLQQLAKRKGKEVDAPHKEDPEIAVCEKQLKRGDRCGSRPLCCQASTCQMFNTMYRTFMDCPHGVKNEECVCIEESLASRTDFSEYYQ